MILASWFLMFDSHLWSAPLVATEWDQALVAFFGLD